MTFLCHPGARRDLGVRVAWIPACAGMTALVALLPAAFLEEIQLSLIEVQ